ncbi:MAG: type II toxin-antitoxin system RelE/ParE family toxin [Patescibacteria group bacterium]
MEISFKSEREKEFYQSKSALTKRYGVQMAKKIAQRIGVLEAARTPQQLPQSARFHEHSGQRKGLFSVDLVDPYRLIVLPTCTYTTWVEITSIQVYEIMDPH